ncbi:MAG: MarR family winged helix-turn-helix transcriptional regulator [Blautia sp.]
MDTCHLKKMIDTCFAARRMVETLPELPSHMKPRHIHVLDVVHEFQSRNQPCRVSDVSSWLHITMPSITKLIQELEDLNLLIKYGNGSDKRVILLRLTDQGLACVEKYVLDFHRTWASQLSDITNEEVQQAIHVFERLNHTMPGRKDKQL